MTPSRQGDYIELRATNPEGDLACDFEIANEKARAGLSGELRRAILGPMRDIPGGIEVTFRSDAWSAVSRYVNLESRCCSFLNLSAERRADVVVLRVTGRSEAEPVIRAIFNEP